MIGVVVGLDGLSEVTTRFALAGPVGPVGLKLRPIPQVLNENSVVPAQLPPLIEKSPASGPVIVTLEIAVPKLEV